MDLEVDRATLGKEPGVDLKEGVYTLPVIDALRAGERSEELRALLAAGPLSGDSLTGVLEIVRSDGAVSRARDAVSTELRRARDEAARLPAGPVRDALVHLAEFIGERCGASV